MSKYQVVVPNEVLMQAYQNVLYGKPDCWDVVGEFDTLEQAENLARTKPRGAIRLTDDPNPFMCISDGYRINPAREPELAERVAAEYKRAEKTEWQAAARILGRKGGSARSERKAKSSAANGRLGGRPRKSK